MFRPAQPVLPFVTVKGFLRNRSTTRPEIHPEGLTNEAEESEAQILDPEWALEEEAVQPETAVHEARVQTNCIIRTNRSKLVTFKESEIVVPFFPKHLPLLFKFCFSYLQL